MTNQPPSRRLRGQVRAQPVAGEQHRPGDPDPAVRADGHGHVVERHTVIHASAAGFAHPVGGDHPAARRAGRTRAGPAARPPRRAGPSWQRAPGRRPASSQPPQLGRHQRDVRAPAGGQRAGLQPRPVTTGVGARRAATAPAPGCPAMWKAGRQHSHRSPGRAPIRSSEARAEVSSAAALSSTPLGCPVEPEVAMTTAVSGPTPGPGVVATRSRRSVLARVRCLCETGRRPRAARPAAAGAGPDPAAGSRARCRRGLPRAPPAAGRRTRPGAAGPRAGVGGSRS